MVSYFRFFCIIISVFSTLPMDAKIWLLFACIKHVGTLQILPYDRSGGKVNNSYAYILLKFAWCSYDGFSHWSHKRRVQLFSKDVNHLDYQNQPYFLEELIIKKIVYQCTTDSPGLLSLDFEFRVFPSLKAVIVQRLFCTTILFYIHLYRVSKKLEIILKIK